MKSNNTFNAILSILCIILAAAVIFLAYQNLQLKKQLGAMYGKRTTYRNLEDIPTMKVGDTAVPFTAILPDGQKLPIKTDSLEAPLILAWFTFNCEPCSTALIEWNDLATTYPGQFFGFTTQEFDEETALFSKNDAAFPILRLETDSILKVYRVIGTPQTMVVRTDGTIGYQQHGPLLPKAYDEVTALVQEPFERR